MLRQCWAHNPIQDVRRTGQTFGESRWCSCHMTACVSAARTRITKPPQDQSVIKGTKAVMACGVTHDTSVTVR